MSPYAASANPIGTKELDATLEGLALLAGTGIVVKTGALTYTVRSLSAGQGISITNPDGVAGNPSISVPNDGITNAILANMAQGTVKGRAAGAGTGDPQDLTPDQLVGVFNLNTNAVNVDIQGSLAVDGNVTIGDGIGDSITINAGTITQANVLNHNRTVGVAIAGASTQFNHTTTFSGDAGGTTDLRAIGHVMTASGSVDITGARIRRSTLTVNMSAGNLNSSFIEQANILNSGAGLITSAIGYDAFFNLTSTGDITNAIGFRSGSLTLSSTGAITNAIGYQANALGHATLVTNAIGFDQPNYTGSLTTTIGFRSQQNNVTGGWGFLHTGTANNAFAGNVRIGSNVVPTVALDITGSLIVSNNATLGDGAGDTLTINAGTWTLGNNFVASRAAGTVAAGAVALSSWNESATGDAGGTSDIRGKSYTLTTQGANAITTSYGLLTHNIHSGSGLVTSTVGVHNTVRITADGDITNGRSFVALVDTAAPSTGNMGNYAGYTASSVNLLGTGTITSVTGFRANNMGHATLVANAISFDAGNNIVSTSLTASFRSLQNSGTNAWAFIHTGTANSAFQGNVRIGSNAPPTVALAVTGDVAISATLGVTGAVNFDGNVTIGDASSDQFNINAASGTLGGSSESLALSRTTTLTSGSPLGLQVQNTNTAAASTATVFGIVGSSRQASADTVTALEGVRALVQSVAGGTGTVANARAFLSRFDWDEAAAVTNADNFLTSTTIDAAAAITTLTAFRSSIVGNAGGGTVTTNIAFDTGAQTVGTSIYGFRGRITSAAGRFNLFMDGNADNAILGNVRIGSISAPVSTLSVSGTMNVTGNVTLGDAVGDSHTINGFTQIIDDALTAFQVSRSGGGDVLRMGANAAGGGGLVEVVNTGATDYEPLILSGETLDLWARTGVLTAAIIARVSNLGLMFPTDNTYDIGQSGSSRPRDIRAARQLISHVATGTAPLAVTSTTLVTNLNADQVDGINGTDLVKRDGTTALTADWDVGSFEVRAQTLEADVATGTAPLTIASTTVVTNLNADMVDGIHGTDLFTTITKTADETLGSDNSLNNDATLQFTMATNTKYTIKLRVFFQTASTPGFKFRVTGPSGASLINIVQRISTSAGTFTGGVSYFTAYHAADVLVLAGNEHGFIDLEIIVHNGATGGTFAFQWAQNTSNATTIVVRAGSTLEYKTA